GRFRRHQFREARLDRIEAGSQCIVFGVRNLRRIFLIIEPVVLFELERQPFPFGPGLRLGEIGDVGKRLCFCCSGHHACLWFVIPGRCEASNPESGGYEHTTMAYYAYMLASRKDGAIYICVTNDIVRRVYEHRIKAVPGFTSKYNITQLVGSRFTTTRLPLISERKNLRNGSGAGR